MDLRCVVCLFTRTDDAQEAVTVEGGHAVCDDHLGLFQDDRLSRAIRAAKDQP